MYSSRHVAANIVAQLDKLRNPDNIAGMTRFGINPKNTLGISIPTLRSIAKGIGKDHSLALKLWNTGIHEARLVAALVDDPDSMTEAQMEKWVMDFDSWDVCDQVCSNLFDKTKFAVKKAAQWSEREEEFVKRAGFVLMAALAVHDKDAEDKIFLSYLQDVKREATDKRNFVRKAVNWALRQIGKRNPELNRAAIRIAKEIRKVDSKAARWVATDALRELTGDAVLRKLNNR